MVEPLPHCPKCGTDTWGKGKQEMKLCPSCKGGVSGMFGKLTCSTCNSTGYICPKHGKFWK